MKVENTSDTWAEVRWRLLNMVKPDGRKDFGQAAIPPRTFLTLDVRAGEALELNVYYQDLEGEISKAEIRVADDQARLVELKTRQRTR